MVQAKSPAPKRINNNKTKASLLVVYSKNSPPSAKTLCQTKMDRYTASWTRKKPNCVVDEGPYRPRRLRQTHIDNYFTGRRSVSTKESTEILKYRNSTNCNDPRGDLDQ